MNQFFKGNRFVYPCKHTRKEGVFCCPICHPQLSKDEKFYSMLKKSGNLLYRLNLDYGNLLNEGLEDRIDQLINLLDKQVKDLKN